MNKLFCFLFFPVVLIGASPVELTISSERHESMPLLVVLDSGMETGAKKVVKNFLAPLLRATKQFAVSISVMAEPQTKKEMQQLVTKGYPLAIFFSGDDEKIFWRLYDVMSVQLVKGVKSGREELSDAQWAIVLADQIWPQLTGQDGSFSSLIAVCRESTKRKKQHARDLYLIHPFYTTEQFEPIKIVDRGNNIAPRWHRRRSVIFYSQHMPTNVRLMSVDSGLVRRVITSFDGQNMTPAISNKGRVVIALSNEQNTQLYEYSFDNQARKGSFNRLTHEPGDFISPSFLSENEIIFCHVNKRNVPQLGILDLSKNVIEWLNVGRALCPAVSAFGRIAYCKRVDGVYQLFTYDRETHEERQLTKRGDHKDECSWSPCGNYITCCIERGEASRIAIVDVDTEAMQYLTPLADQWSYPSWSPRLSIPFAYRKNG